MVQQSKRRDYLEVCKTVSVCISELAYIDHAYIVYWHSVSLCVQQID